MEEQEIVSEKDEELFSDKAMDDNLDLVDDLDDLPL